MADFNTCSIKLLTDAHIGAGVRMTKGTNTVPFKNLPMRGLKIEDYNKLGFKISHENLPKVIWVDFDQLPLTRVVMRNGVIEDEITFVENIVLHKMQLIRTEDTEYIELLYNERALKRQEIIPNSEAIIGDWYKGAQCKEGLEMVYLGTWYTKSVVEKGYWNYYSYGEKKPNTFHLVDKSPKRIFFACKEGTKWDVISFPVTNKRIKDLIKLDKSEEMFQNRNLNRELILMVANKKEYDNSDKEYNAHNKPSTDINGSYQKPKYAELFKIKRYGHVDCNYISDTNPKDFLDEEAFNWVNSNLKCELQTIMMDGGGYRSSTTLEIKFNN